MRELDHRGKHALAGVSGDDLAAAVVFAGDCERDQYRETDGHQRIEIRNVLPRTQSEGRSPARRCDHQQCHHRDRADGGPHEIPLEAVKGSLTPCQQRADGSENQEQQGDGDGDAVVKGRAHGDLIALREFGNLREPGAPEYGEAKEHEEKIVEQETRLAGDQRFKFMLAPQMLFVLEEEENEDREADGEEPRKPASDRRLREGVD